MGRDIWPAPNQKVCLIESPRPDPAGMQGHRQDNIEAVLFPKRQKSQQKQLAERPGQLNFAPEFKAMNDFRYNSVVYQRCPGNAEFFTRCNAGTAIVILTVPALKGYSAANAKRRFNHGQLCETVRAQAGCQRYLRLIPNR